VTAGRIIQPESWPEVLRCLSKKESWLCPSNGGAYAGDGFLETGFPKQAMYSVTKRNFRIASFVLLRRMEQHDLCLK
jgi:hypothetical protein